MLNRFFSHMRIISALVLLVAGAGLILAYMLEAIIKRLGEPDQSLLFWYLPILFLGILAVGSGFRLLARRRRSGDTQADR